MGKKNRKVNKRVDVGTKKKRPGTDMMVSRTEFDPELFERLSIDAASREDPLKNWVPPETDDCPICLLPMPINDRDRFHWFCCDKSICQGCKLESMKVERKVSFKCPFCTQVSI